MASSWLTKRRTRLASEKVTAFVSALAAEVGVVDEDVGLPAPLPAGVVDPLDVLGLGEIGGDGVRRDAMSGRRLRRLPVELCLAPSDEDEVTVPGRVYLCEEGAEPAVRSRDECRVCINSRHRGDTARYGMTRGRPYG